MTNSELIKSIAVEEKPYLVILRRYFHRHPELSAKEYNTADKIEEELKKLHIPSKRVGETGVYAEIKGELAGNKTIVLRADTDALAINEEHDCPYKSETAGVMHACGHDAHTAALLGAAKILAQHKNLFGGTVRLTFQPGEEYGIGARIFVQNGYLDGADRTFGVHMASDVPAGKVALTAGPNNAAVDWFGVKIHGKSSHITTPELGADALLAAAEIASNAKKAAAEAVNGESHLIGIGKLTAGTAYNAVAAEAQFEGTVRTYSLTARKTVREALEMLIAQAASKFGCTATTEWKDFTSPLINDEEATKEAQKTAAKLFGDKNIIKDRAPAFGGDDFAEYILKVPGVYAYIGSRNEKIAETCEPHHSTRFDIDEDALVISAALYAAYAVDFLNSDF